VFLSGLLWIAAQQWLGDGATFGESASPWVPFSMKIHGAAAMAVLVVIGTLLPVHVRRAWNARRNRGTGATTLGLNALLIVSGYALYYLAGEGTRALTSLVHWILGLALPAVLVFHVLEARSARPNARWRNRRGGKGRRHAVHGEAGGQGEPVSVPPAGGQLHRVVTEGRDA
jgi:hypothetical protein